MPTNANQNHVSPAADSHHVPPQDRISVHAFSISADLHEVLGLFSVAAEVEVETNAAPPTNAILPPTNPARQHIFTSQPTPFCRQPCFAVNAVLPTPPLQAATRIDVGEVVEWRHKATGHW